MTKSVKLPYDLKDKSDQRILAVYGGDRVVYRDGLYVFIEVKE